MGDSLNELMKTHRNVMKMSLISEAVIDALNDPSLARDVKVSVLKSVKFPSSTLPESEKYLKPSPVKEVAPPEFRRLVESNLDKILSDLNVVSQVVPGQDPAGNMSCDLERSKKELFGQLEKLSAQYKACSELYVDKYKNLVDKSNGLSSNVSAASHKTCDLLKNLTTSIIQDSQTETLLSIETGLIQQLSQLDQEKLDLEKKLEPFKGREKEFLALTQELVELDRQVAIQEEVVKLTNHWCDNELNESVMSLSNLDESQSFVYF